MTSLPNTLNYTFESLSKQAAGELSQLLAPLGLPFFYPHIKKLRLGNGCECLLEALCLKASTVQLRMALGSMIALKKKAAFR